MQSIQRSLSTKNEENNIRWITVVLVVIYHVVYMFNGIETAGVIGPLSDKVQYQDIFEYVVYPWFMVLLFVVCGNVIHCMGAAVSSDRLQLVKLYPEGNAEGRFKISGVKRIYACCNRDGLFYIDVRSMMRYIVKQKKDIILSEILRQEIL